MISPDDIVSLRKLTRLEELHLIPGPDKDFDIPGFEDTDFQALISGLNNLRGLSLLFSKGKLTMASLTAIAESHPFLASCRISCPVNLLELKARQAPLFRELRALAISGFIPEPAIHEPGNSKIAAARHATMLESYFPKTTYLKCWGPDRPLDVYYFSWDVERAREKSRKAQGKEPIYVPRSISRWLW
ncbi:hypothetical protein BJX70DRAFT_219314 [Aspergillus crustosus]